MSHLVRDGASSKMSAMFAAQWTQDAATIQITAEFLGRVPWQTIFHPLRLTDSRD